MESVIHLLNNWDQALCYILWTAKTPLTFKVLRAQVADQVLEAEELALLVHWVSCGETHKKNKKVTHQMNFTSYHFLLTRGTTRKVLALVNKLLLCVEEGIAFSSIRSYGHLNGHRRPKRCNLFSSWLLLKFAVHYDLSILIHSTLALEYFSSRKTIFLNQWHK